MRHIFLAIILFILNIKNNTWKFLPKYNGSLRFVIIVNAMYYILYKDRPLWDFRSIRLNPMYLRMLHVFIITPLLILLFLSRAPKKISIPWLYILKWTGISMAIEWMASTKGKMIVYQYGWNTFWSGLIFLEMYVYSFLYTKRPVFTWMLTSLSIFHILAVFNMPKETKRKVIL